MLFNFKHPRVKTKSEVLFVCVFPCYYVNMSNARKLVDLLLLVKKVVIKNFIR